MWNINVFIEGLDLAHISLHNNKVINREGIVNTGLFKWSILEKPGHLIT
jgi:hypothetical protein